MEVKNNIKVIVGFMLLLCSCNREAFRDNKAYERVLNNKELAEKTFKALEVERPCNSDSIVISKSDTIVHHDTSYVLKEGKRILIKDTLYIYDTLLQRITTIKSIHDTVQISTVDNRRLQLARDSIYGMGIELKEVRWKVEQLQKEHNEIGTMLKYAGLALLRKWWFWLIVVGFVGYRLRSFFLPNILSLFKGLK